MKGIGYWRERLSLRGKLSACIVVPSLIIISILYSYSIRSMTANFDREYREKAMAIAQTLQQSIGKEDLEDSSRMTAILQGLTVSNRTLSRLSVYVPRGDLTVVGASSDPGRIGELAEEHDLDPMRTGQPLLFEHTDGQPHLIEANVPLVVGGLPVATMGVYMSLEARDALVYSQTLSLLVIGGGGVILILGLVYLLTERLIVEPVARISRAASRIAGGHLDTRVPDLGHDEVGKLASSVSAMVEELMEDRRTLERLATTDGLTGLWNHRFFYERLREELSRAARLKEPLSLIVLDLDRLKGFNDKFGHLKGDEALRSMGQILRGSVRPYDVPCRYGGDEFAVIVPGAEASVAREVAERVRRRIAGQNFKGEREQPVTFTASFGISSYLVDDSNPESLVRAADSALYEAKRAGGNAVRVYDPHPGADVEGKPSP